MKLGNKSKYIVNYYGSYFSRKTNTLWLILEYCASGSIIDLMLSMNRTFTEIEISTIMENVLHGLILIHSMNLIHRDIKGANILLSEDGYAKLGDFGVGIKLSNDSDYRKSKKGSPYWMSPQVVKNKNYDMKTDIWSLGITCVELCNGEPPFSDLNPKNVMEKIAKFPPNINDVINKNEHTEEFYDFVKKCLEVEPRNRPTAKELIEHNFIKKYSKGNQFLAQLVAKHSEDINKFRKIVNERNKNNDLLYLNNFYNKNNNINVIKEENIVIDNNDDDFNNDLIKISINESIKGSSNEDNKQNINNEINFTSHFHNESNKNNIQEKKHLSIDINNFSSSQYNIENINSTKDSQKQLKNIIFINIKFYKITICDKY
jgi:serine/threonine protein kinase